MIALNNNLPIKDILPSADMLWWPLAPLWWLLLLVTLFTVLLIYKKRRHATVQRKKYIQKSLQLLETLTKEQDDHAVIEGVSVLLRRTAMSLYGRRKVAGLSANSWIQFLDKTGNTTDFTEGIGKVLLDQPYRKHSNFDRQAVIGLAQQWLEAQLQQGRNDV